jgi:hypothetical protein
MRRKVRVRNTSRRECHEVRVRDSLKARVQACSSNERYQRGKKRKLEKMHGGIDEQATIKRDGMYSLNVEHKVY